MKFLGTAVGCGWLDSDQFVPLQRQDVTPERGAIHHHVIRKFVDRQRSPSLELRKD